MHKNATKCNKTQRKWCINKHGASKIIDTFETYQSHFMFCTHAKYTHLMENTCAPTAGMASSSGQDIPKVILGFFC
jgi:hypothetical protein